MHALVVYESMFGNTRAIAEAVAQGLGDGTVVAEVGTSPVIAGDLDVLVVGGPTHAFGLTRESTRESARQQSPDGHVLSDRIGVREWLDALPAPTTAMSAAAFDTRVAPARVPGSAARGIGKRLRHKGFHLVVEPHTFWVTGTPGPLVTGELDNARVWGRAVAAALALHHV